MCLGRSSFFLTSDIAESPEGYLYVSTSQQDPDEGHPRPDEEDDLLLRSVPASLPPSGHPKYKASPSCSGLSVLIHKHGAV